MDWLFGISDNEFSLSSMGDIISFLLELNELKELRYELEINDKFFNDIETEDNRWYANIKFYGNEKGHLYNADMCQFLASLNESRESFESYFTPKDMFDIWKKQKIADLRDETNIYNTYKHKGLTPTPICSPSLIALEAVANPAKTNYLFFVASKDGEHLFSETYDVHRRYVNEHQKK